LIARAALLFQIYLVLDDLADSLENFRSWNLFVRQNLIDYTFFSRMFLCLWDIEELFVFQLEFTINLVRLSE